MRRPFDLIVGCVLISSVGALWADSRADDRSRSTDVAALTKSLRDPDVNVRRVAARRLGELGAAAKSSVPDLLPLLEDEDELVRSAAASALFSLGAPSEPMRALLKDPYAQVQITVAQELVKGDQDLSIALETLLHIALSNGDENDYANLKARGTLTALSPKLARMTVPKLIEKFGDKDADVSGQAVQLMREIMPFVPDVVSQLLPLLEDKRPNVRLAAIHSIENCGGAASIANPILRLLLNDPDNVVANAAAATLYSIDPASPEVIAFLKEALLSDSVARRQSAVSILTERGPISATILDGIYWAIEKDDVDVGECALWALGTTPFPTQAMLAKMLDPSRPEEIRELATRMAAAASLETCNSLLTLALADPAARTRNSAATVAQDVPTLSPATIKGLELLLKETDVKVRIVAATALIRHKHGTLEIVQMLEAQLHQNDVSLFGDAVRTLGEMKSAAAPAIPSLVKALSERRRYFNGDSLN